MWCTFIIVMIVDWFIPTVCANFRIYWAQKHRNTICWLNIFFFLISSKFLKLYFHIRLMFRWNIRTPITSTFVCLHFIINRHELRFVRKKKIINLNSCIFLLKYTIKAHIYYCLFLSQIYFFIYDLFTSRWYVTF